MLSLGHSEAIIAVRGDENKWRFSPAGRRRLHAEIAFDNMPPPGPGIARVRQKPGERMGRPRRVFVFRRQEDAAPEALRGATVVVIDVLRALRR